MKSVKPSRDRHHRPASNLIFNDIKRASTLYAYHIHAHSIVSKISKLTNESDNCAFIVAQFPVGMQKNIRPFLATEDGKEYLDHITTWN